MDKSKIIIENRTTTLSDVDCLEYAKEVIKLGRISNGDKQYCYLTVFGDVKVSTTLNKNSDKFIIYN